ncbi:M15 family metallopeptidase [Actinotalea sp. BY-33]|uniref:M15 family metallopeptidase n=1 Tax=Actinotalea soli TaxID=2819234 RepID=A0A939LS79_9CELL|nr:M15 family metallopeptidase [Actinotalea soli]MBO1753133.1 M15 family metallopeptidase [Actinotalea soli]
MPVRTDPAPQQRTEPRPGTPRRARRRTAATVAALLALGLGLASFLGATLTGGPTEPTAADGRIPDGETVSPFDDSVPSVSRLDPALLAALREAASVVEADGRPLHVTSGWRSAAYQQWLQEDALRTYGSAEEAARWVASAETSAHVTGDAVDVGPYATAEWLSRHGAPFGLCQVYANEVWHIELRPEAPEDGCPELIPDASAAPGAGE